MFILLHFSRKKKKRLQPGMVIHANPIEAKEDFDIVAKLGCILRPCLWY